MFSYLTIFFMLNSFLFSLSEYQYSPIRVYDLRCNALKEPLGVDTPHPFLTWKLDNPTQERGVYQTAYQIVVSSSGEKVESLEGDLWDSGKMEDKRYQVVYIGKPLKKGQRVWWRVRIWDDKGRVSDFSEPSWWEMGLINEDNWEGKWIEPSENIYPRKLDENELFHFNPAIFFRKNFVVDKKVKKARLYISGLGYYIPYINGMRVGDNELDPGWTAYEKRIFYSVFDITNMIREGENVVGALVGSGWYNPLPLKMWRRINLREHLPVGIPKLRAQIELKFEDETGLVIPTDGRWKCQLSPIVKNNVYLGEEYDEKLEQEGWSSVGFDDSHWYSAQVSDKPG
ncbi:MAG: alpha-L-rhamnosidase N-terminal domain-containing protein, partial [Candidatus Hydrogenedentes bacterium]|nr:alpha-L-rhamnosidase N-terminal domain-containing protein [Candidatus Hydrogenedentota bacterium]